MQSLLKTTIVPYATAMHTIRLSLTSKSEPISVLLSLTRCVNILPLSLSTAITGEDNNFILFVTSVPSSRSSGPQSQICYRDPLTGRPLIGIVNFPPSEITNFRRAVTRFAREMLHTMGFAQEVFADRHMITTLSEVRGKQNVRALNSPNVIREARRQYNCSNLTFVELEDADTSSSAPVLWKQRNLVNELMTHDQGIGLYSALTIAAMEDTGYYTGNYINAEDIMWARNAGCSFIFQKCINNGKTEYSQLFCTSNTQQACAPDRLSVSACDVQTSNGALPVQFQYFNNANTGGSSPYMDYCPYYGSANNIVTNCVTASNELNS